MMPGGTHSVTNCLVLIQDLNQPKVNELVSFQYSAFLLSTAVNKYVIGIGQGIRRYLVFNYYNEGFISPYKPLYPFIQIEPEKGIMALKCPTISGGKWVMNVGLVAGCKKVAPVAKGQMLNIIIRYCIRKSQFNE